MTAEDCDVDERRFATRPLAAGPGFVQRGQRTSRFTPPEPCGCQGQQRVVGVSPVPTTRETADRLPQLAKAGLVSASLQQFDRRIGLTAERDQVAKRRPRLTFDAWPPAPSVP